MNGHIHSKGGRVCTKIDAIKQAVIGPEGVLDNLRLDDRVGVVCFNTDTKVVQEVVNVRDVLRDRIAAMVQQQQAVGGTRLCNAIEVASRLLGHVLAKDSNQSDCGFVPPPSLVEDLAPRQSPLRDLDQVSITMEGSPRQRGVDPAESRIVVVTDEYLCTSQDHEDALKAVKRLAAKKRIHTTFIAVGTGYTEEVDRRIRSVPGCSSVPVHSAEELQQKLVHDFNFTAFPVAYNLSVEVDSPPLEVVEPFGSAYGQSQVVRERTVFSGSGSDAVHCSLGVFRLRNPLPVGAILRYTTSYTDRFGVEHSEVSEVPISNGNENKDFRKVVALCRLGTVLRVFLSDEHQGTSSTQPTITSGSGVVRLPDALRPTPTPPASVPEGEVEYSDQGDDDRLFDDDIPERRGSLVDAEPVPQSKVSEHYRTVLSSFLESYFGPEAAAAEDPKMQLWADFLKSVTNFIPDKQVEEEAAAHVTTPLIVSKSDADSVFDELNKEKFSNCLREHHRRAVHRVYDAKMYSVLRQVASSVIAQHPSWLLANEAHHAEVDTAARKAFKDVDGDDAWARWRERWGALLEATLKATLHGRLFDVALSAYTSHKARGDVNEQILVDDIMAQLAQRTDEVSSAAQEREVRSFLTRWIVPPLLKHAGRCVWSFEQGVPVGEDAAAEEAPQCPTQ
eukprot:TRINITY_DN12296_c0_g1_i4.p1 TRINITY_DN12296_c0_g1~~TRINITY_DN12296_c0_g1_i4.p1  ORF type:complete len:674 (+),score=183.49 TRINITY_DN12296_c0_g1_i4:437-2458(+)